MLRALIEREGDTCTNAIVFCNRKTDVDIVAKSLKKHGLDAAPIHGDLEQSQRTRTLDSFREGSLRFLVASDVAARGLDVPAVSHVFNYDVPSHSEDYVHRIGRTGRAGRDGKAVMIAVPADEKLLAAIEKLIDKEIPRAEGPGSAQPDAATADTPKAEEKPRRTRRRAEPKPESQAEQKELVDTASETQSSAEPGPEVRTTETNHDERPAKERNRGGGRHNRRDDRNKVVGMGDHMPSFIAMSFEERKAS